MRLENYDISIRGVSLDASVAETQPNNNQSWFLLVPKIFKGGVAVGYTGDSQHSTLVESPHNTRARFNLLLPSRHGAIAVIYPGPSAGLDVPFIDIWTDNLHGPDTPAARRFITSRYSDDHDQHPNHDIALFWGEMPLEGCLRPVGSKVEYQFYLPYHRPVQSLGQRLIDLPTTPNTPAVYNKTPRLVYSPMIRLGSLR